MTPEDADKLRRLTILGMESDALRYAVERAIREIDYGGATFSDTRDVLAGVSMCWQRLQDIAEAFMRSLSRDGG